MNPWEQLAEALVPDPDAGDPAVNVYPSWAEAGLVTPAVVLQPDEPWMEPSAFGFDQERYVAIAAVTASSGRLSGVADLYAIVRHIIRRVMAVEGVAYETVTAPVIDESTGAPVLAASVRLTYRNCSDLEAS